MNWKKWSTRAKLIATTGFQVGVNFFIPTSIGAAVGYFPTLFFGPAVLPLTYIGALAGFVYGGFWNVGYLVHTARVRAAWRRAGNPRSDENLDPNELYEIDR